VGVVKICKGTVGEAEQQPYGKLEQLDAEAKAIIDPMAIDWTYLGIGAKNGINEGRR